VKLPLPDVTLVAVDTICHELAALAIRECADQAQFGAIQIHTDDPAPFRRLGIDAAFIDAAPFRSLNAVMRYLWYDVPPHVQTSHALTVQWDSGIVSPAQWSAGFLGCDYVGAPWGWHGDEYEVGNGGFSLRSRRLMHYIAGPTWRCAFRSSGPVFPAWSGTSAITASSTGRGCFRSPRCTSGYSSCSAIRISSSPSTCSNCCRRSKANWPKPGAAKSRLPEHDPAAVVRHEDRARA
jgi:hypothetical protein